MTLFAATNRVLVKPFPVPDTTESGLVTRTGKVNPSSGTVVNIGPASSPDEPNVLAVGDTVYFASYGYPEVKDEDGTALLSIDSCDIYAYKREPNAF